jgi:hypothetical protein
MKKKFKNIREQRTVVEGLGGDRVHVFEVFAIRLCVGLMED